LLTSLIIFLNSGIGCAPVQPLLVRPAYDIPARPAMLPVEWRHADGQHCLDDSQAQNLLINTSRLQAHIEVLEAYLEAVKE
jgi:hypothetical protein